MRSRESAPALRSGRARSRKLYACSATISRSVRLGKDSSSGSRSCVCDAVQIQRLAPLEAVLAVYTSASPLAMNREAARSHNSSRECRTADGSAITAGRAPGAVQLRVIGMRL